MTLVAWKFCTWLYKRIGLVHDPLSISLVCDPLRIGLIHDPLRISLVHDPLRISLVCDALRINLVHDPLRINLVHDPLRINLVHDPLRTGLVCDPLRISLVWRKVQKCFTLKIQMFSVQILFWKCIFFRLPFLDYFIMCWRCITSILLSVENACMYSYYKVWHWEKDPTKSLHFLLHQKKLPFECPSILIFTLRLLK